MSEGKPLLALACYYAVEPAVTRHLPFWNASGCRVACYFSDMIPDAVSAQGDTALVGPAGHSGTHANVRIRSVFNRALADALYHGAPYVIIGEYDTVTFRPPPGCPPDGELHAPCHQNTEPHRFKSALYPHPVWRLNIPTLKRFCDVANTSRVDTEDGFLDRWIGRVCEDAGIALVNDPLTYSRNTIDTAEYAEQARACLRAGGWAVHGVKTKEQLASVLFPQPHIP